MITEEFVRHAIDLASGTPTSVATKTARNQWSIVSYASMRAALKYAGEGDFVLRHAPRDERLLTTKELKKILNAEKAFVAKAS